MLGSDRVHLDRLDVGQRTGTASRRRGNHCSVIGAWHARSLARERG
jgi:hypothetical protein